ncbi:MAG: AAA family ATPase [Deltaproteobacteria bacterium]|nr:AAA family ATPase [Deltaproteobacteria bacterium]
MKENPMAVRNFSEFKANNLFYADKTKLLHDILRTRGSFFLPRPRRLRKNIAGRRHGSRPQRGGRSL